MKLIWIAMLVGLTACHSGWDQDPFTGQEENVKKAVPQDGNKKKTPPELGVMKIDVDSTYVFKEGQKRIIPIDYRLLHPEFKFLGVEIPNLESELPGAIYDETKRELTFEPEEGYVPTGAILYSTILRVSLFAEYQGLKQEIRKEVVFHVVKGSAESPQILSIDGLDRWIHEGKTDEFTVRIRDEVSAGGPVLVIQNPNSSWYNGAQFVTYNRQGRPVVGSPGVWEFRGTIDLSNARDITSSNESFRFEVQAYSLLGVPSNTRSVDYRVYTSAMKPEFSYENLDFTVGEKGFYNFSIYDPRNEGELVARFLTDCSGLPGGAQCKCRNIGSMSRCTLEWTPSQAGRYRVEVAAENTVNKFQSSELTAQSTGSFYIDVVDAPGGAQ